MRFFKFLIVLILANSFVSCITNKDIVYLQGNDKNGEGIQLSEIDAKPYRVQVNDVISINIKAIDSKLVELFSPSTSTTNSTSQMSQQGLYFNGFTVDSHGNIRIPVIGELNVLGFTLDEIRLKVEDLLLKEYFKTEARIFVNVKLAGFKYVMMGEVGSPGTQVLFQDNVTILEAIANSGDIPVTGNRKDIQIIRKHPNGYETISVDVTDAALLKSPKLYLQPNDYVYVKPLKQKSWGTGTTAIQTVGTIMTALSLITTSIVLLKNL